jgi:hypothetical protein
MFCFSSALLQKHPVKKSMLSGRPKTTPLLFDKTKAISKLQSLPCCPGCYPCDDVITRINASS